MSSKARFYGEEADRVADMVLQLVTEVVRRHKDRRLDVVRGVEPTGIRVTPEMRPFVEKRSDKRKAS